MPAVTVRNLPEETRPRAQGAGGVALAQRRSGTPGHHRNAVRPRDRIKLGSELAAIGREFGGVELDIDRDKTPADAASFE